MVVPWVSLSSSVLIPRRALVEHRNSNFIFSPIASLERYMPCLAFILSMIKLENLSSTSKEIFYMGSMMFPFSSFLNTISGGVTENS